MSNDNKSLRSFLALEIFSQANELAKQGKEIFHLEVGEPGLKPSPLVIKTLQENLQKPQKYTSAKGLTELRNELVNYYFSKYEVKISANNIIITNGSSAGFVIAFLCSLEKGAKIALTRPGYPAYLNIVAGLGLEAIEIPLSSNNQWRLSAKDIEQIYEQQPFDALLFASPANPTGSSVSDEEFEKIIEVCNRLNIQFISDEIYHGLEYNKPSNTALKYSNNPIIVNSFSKYFCMTGYRVGWLILPNDLIDRAEILQQNMFISAPTLSQIGAISALKDIDYCELQRRRYLQNRNIMTNGLKALGFKNITQADGAFYTYADVSPFSNDSRSFCKNMLLDIGVAATPGEDFDRVNGHRYVRFSFAGKQSKIEMALEKMASYLSQPM